ncbi:hypothetical protein PRIPAC_94369 [Pristionchus pacificus]|uniref:Uncharacterized protein n=1 Tax=Pristionchus pacificus TaxID=54126 RepID=A0A2A6BIE0_PRIPA|nr:hypothetical protein PRIPAC_94369 [Pristionchus pacificus]|eukprot:PDM65670.1 hypothetical protein PRIPAC_45584 [Pristionchus pacificus]
MGPSGLPTAPPSSDPELFALGSKAVKLEDRWNVLGPAPLLAIKRLAIDAGEPTAETEDEAAEVIRAAARSELEQMRSNGVIVAPVCPPEIIPTASSSASKDQSSRSSVKIFEEDRWSGDITVLTR